MSVLVIYDSRFGNTERVARAIAEQLGPASEVRIARAGEMSPLELDEVDLLVVGAPTEHHGTPPVVRNLLEGVRPGTLAGVEAVAFDTRLHHAQWWTGSAAATIAEDLRQLGCELVVPAESFFVEGRGGPLEEPELERARSWARSVARRLRESAAEETS